MGAREPLLGILCLSLWLAAHGLQFGADRHLRIVQLTDLHLDGDSANDARTQQVHADGSPCYRALRGGSSGRLSASSFSLQVMRSVLEAELAEGRRVDLVALSGDMVSGYAWNGSEAWYAGRWALHAT